MTQNLHFADAASLHDLGTLIRRARRVNEQGVRLQAVGTVLAAWIPVMTPSSLTSRLPAVLGLRTMALTEPSQTDVTVELDAISERLARLNPAEMILPVPPGRINAPWAAVTPPRSGWEAAGTVEHRTLAAAADAGVSEVAQAVPDSAGAHVVEQVRERVWSRPLEPGESDTVPEEAAVPTGAAFGAHALGFLSEDDGATTEIFKHGRWIRLSAPRGHIICRAV